MKSRSWFVFGGALALTLALPLMGHADDKDRPSKTWTVHFGQPQPQTPDPAPVGGAVTHFLTPNDLTIVKGDSVTFVVNGGGHGIAIHPVAKKTTRADIAEDLCDGTNNDNNEADNPSAATQIANRRARAAVCNGNVATGQTVNGVAVVGTQNLEYMITDGKDNLIIDSGFNADGAVNPRLDDTIHTHRLLGTSGRSPAGDTTVPGQNPAGAFLTGSNPPVTTPPAVPNAPGNRIQVHFLKTGRYLVICMNRGHSLNDHMFGFVNVVEDEDND